LIHPWKRSLATFGLGCLAFGALTWICVASGIHFATAMLLFLCVALAAAFVGGIVPAISLSAVAILVLNRFFSRLTVSANEEIWRVVLELGSFIAATAIVSALAATAQRREQFLQRVLDALPAMVGYSKDGKLLMFGGDVPGYSRVTQKLVLQHGWPPSNVHPDDLEKASGARRLRDTGAEPFEYELRLQGEDGKYHWFLARVVPIRDPKGRITHWVGTMFDIDDVKRVKESIQEKARLLDLSHDAILVRDLDDRVTYWNRAAEEFTGWTREELIGKSTAEVLDSNYSLPFEQAKAETLRTGRWEGEASTTTKDGRTITASVRWSLQTNVKGEPIGILVSATDITERKRTEERLREAADLLNLTHDAIFVRDLDNIIVYWNRGAEELYGYTAEEAMGKTAHALLNTKFPEALEAIDAQLKRADRWEGELVHARSDGTQVIVSSRWSLRRDQAGAPLSVMETNTDVSKRKEAEEMWKASFECNPTMYFVIDPDATVSLVNAYGAEQLGYSISELIGKPVLDVFYPADRELIQARTAQCFAHPGQTMQWEARKVRKDGSMLWVRETANAVIINQRLVLLVVCEDMTDKKRADEEIKALQEQLYRENIALREEIDRTSMFEEIVGSSEPLRKVLNSISKVAASDSTVMITGETGTGKELIARAIHKRSRRAARALVSVNCAAIPQTLIASELFGHEKGAFTGALQRRLGRFEIANGGTIFLDEVGDLPAETQVALLRILQEHEFERVGGTQRVKVDVRVLSATNRDLKAAVEGGTFRRDLYYRLNVFPIEVPSLRDRAEDLPVLVEYFIQRYASKEGKRIRNIDKKTLTMFQQYEWPGNIRELQNVVERAVILSEDDTFRVEDTWLSTESRPAPVDFVALPLAIDGHEREMIEEALKAARGRIAGPAGAAARLGIPRSTLESKIRTLGIDKHRFRSPGM
jgi:formate hydrogenlyase transcriptional activator